MQTLCQALNSSLPEELLWNAVKRRLMKQPLSLESTWSPEQRIELLANKFGLVVKPLSVRVLAALHGVSPARIFQLQEQAIEFLKKSLEKEPVC